METQQPAPSLVFTPAGVPVGQYRARFAALTFKKSEQPGWRDSWLWQFVIEGGPYNGQSVDRFTSTRPSKKNSAGLFWRAVTGAEPQIGVAVDFTQFVGKAFHVDVQESPSGGSTRVDSLIAVQVENVGIPQQ